MRRIVQQTVKNIGLEAMTTGSDPAKLIGTALAPSRSTLPLQWQGWRADDPQQLSDAMAIAYAMIASVERNAKQLFAEIDERQLSAEALAFAQELAATGDIRLPAESGRAEIHDVAVLLRALEQLRLEFDRAIEGDGLDDLEDASRTSDGRHFVLPRISSLAGKTTQPFTRRALLHYRVLPTSIQGFDVRLYSLRALADAATAERLRDGDGRRLGAAFFPGLEVITSSDGAEFTVNGLKGFAPPGLIETHVTSARRDDCSAIVWAELTMPEVQISMLRESLRRHALDRGTAPEFFVAGSWHREINGQMRNVSRILDGSGATIFELVKWAKYSLDGQFEAIVPGREIPILVTESETIVMAICRDFLDETAEPPYCQLDVDLAIVPSMASLARAATMTGHIATARTMSIRYGTQSMVVQQPPEPDPEGRAGLLLLYPKRPADTAAPAEIKTPWSLCQLESL